MNEEADTSPQDLIFTGEYFVPGKSEQRIHADHIARYQFAKKYAPGKSVLDIACGVGYAAPIILGAGARSYMGADIQKHLVDYAQKTYGNENATFCLLDITKLQFDEEFDLITCFETIEHVGQYEIAINNLHRALRPGGTLLISSPNRPITSPKAINLKDKPSNEFHTQEFTPDELAATLCNSGFIIDPRDIYGQRQRLHSDNRYARKIINAFNPDSRTSPRVQPILKNKISRYFVISASKPTLR
jgi:SAM-dependent methyltransferase